MTRALEDLLLRFGEDAPSDLGSQLKWLEDASQAATSAAAELGEPADAAALDLRAALGAFVEFTRGPQGPGELMALEITVKALIARALHTLYGALSETYLALGKEDIERAKDCRELARLWSSLQKSVATGKPLRRDLIEKVSRTLQKLDR